MPDEKPEQERPAEEAKKDTVRINLPPGLTGRGASVGPAASSAPKVAPPTPSASPEEEAKKETAVLGRPAEAPKPKQDTSRVQVVAAKPSPAPGRPAVKLRRDEPAPAPAPAAAAPHAAAPAMTPATSAADLGLSVVAMILSLVVAGYLAWLAFG